MWRVLQSSKDEMSWCHGRALGENERAEHRCVEVRWGLFVSVIVTWLST